MTGAAVIASHERAGRVAPVRLGVRLGEPTGELREAAFATGGVAIGDARLRVDVEGATGVACLDLRVDNAGDRPLRVASVLVGMRWSGGADGSLRYLRHGWQSRSVSGSRPLAPDPPPRPGSPPAGAGPSRVAVPRDRLGWHESEWVSVVGRSPVGPACCFGTLEGGRAFGVVYLRADGDGVLAEVELLVDAVLEPRRGLELERVRVALGLDAGLLLEDFAAAHGRHAGARVASPFAPGWCGWQHRLRPVGEAELLRSLEELSARRDELPVEVVVLDEGYQRATGDWLETHAGLPRGLSAAAEEIREAGFTAGLWTAPFCVASDSRLFAERPEWLLSGADGPRVAFEYAARAPAREVYVLDASRAEVTEHLRSLSATLVERGFTHLELDLLQAAALESPSADPAVGRAARLRRGIEAVRAGAGPECFLLGAGPLGVAVGVVDAMRTAPDAGPALPGASVAAGALARAWMHRRLWLNHPGRLVVAGDGGRSEAQTRSLAAAVACSGGFCVLADDPRALPPERRALAREVLEIARAVDAQGLPGRARLSDPLAAGPLLFAARNAEGATALLLNAGEKPAPAPLEAGLLGAGPPEPLLGTRPPPAEDSGGALRLAAGESACFHVRREVRLAVFCDFDGTFSVQDVGATLARRHAGDARPRHWGRYQRGEITAWEYNMQVLHGLALPQVEVERFLETVDLDPGAKHLLDWCEMHGVPFRVLSDGFDSNLYRLQQLHGVSFGFDANQLRYDRGRWRLRAGHPDPGCGCGTGTCKSGRIGAFRARWPGAVLVHVGNGRVSDLCGALAADVAFAKDSLAEELAARGHRFEPFETLHDVVAGLERLWAGAASASGN